MDKYNDQILKRGDYVFKLRTDDRINGFIDKDAVVAPYSKRVLTLEELLTEVEKDEVYELVQLGKKEDQINHKEFITWREFMTYFQDFREIEDRNKKAKDLLKTRQAMQKERKMRGEG